MSVFSVYRKKKHLKISKIEIIRHKQRLREINITRIASHETLATKASVVDNTPWKKRNVQYRHQNTVTAVEETAWNVNEERWEAHT